ncbi:MAG: zinc/iron permease, partial [Bacteroidota bacterium]
KQWVMLMSFVLMTPAGALLGKAILEQGGGGMDEFFHAMLALATGSFLQISTTILFESSTHHKFSLQPILLAFTGALLAYLM